MPPRAGAAATPLLVLLGLVGLLGGLTGCSRDVPVAPPSPTPAAATACAALAQDLPQRLDGHERRPTEPTSVLTAAWGKPAITVRCGVGRPPQLVATSELATVDDVDWLPIQLTHGYRFVTVGRVAYVEVDVPEDYDPEINVVVDLATPIKENVPTTGDVSASPDAS